MKLETLAKRLAEKTGTPVLEQVVLGERPVTDLPMECMIWTGAAFGTSGQRMRVSRAGHDGLRVDVVNDVPYGIIQYQGKRISVRRLIFQLINKPDYEFRMSPLCGVPLCVNPLHHTVERVEPKPEPVIEEATFDGDEGWDIEEVEALVEILLTENTPENWADVTTHPLMGDVPHDLLRTVLRDMNKEHLT